MFVTYLPAQTRTVNCVWLLVLAVGAELDAQKEGYSFDEAFGKLLGTIALCSAWPVILSFMPHRALKKIFPPIVTGITIFLIGTKLVATGFKVGGAC